MLHQSELINVRNAAMFIQLFEVRHPDVPFIPAAYMEFSKAFFEFLTDEDNLSLIEDIVNSFDSIHEIYESVVIADNIQNDPWVYPELCSIMKRVAQH